MKRIVKVLLAVLLFVGGFQTVHAQEEVNTQIEEALPGTQFLVLGSGLSPEMVQYAYQVYGVQDLPEENILWINGNDVNYYTENGADENTIIYSTALITVGEPGSGLRVDVLTPETITTVTAPMYQSTLQTAGAKDIHVKVANVTSELVTGRGALAGIYRVMEHLDGVNLDDIKTAEEEIDTIQGIIDREDEMSGEQTPYTEMDQQATLAVVSKLKEDTVQYVQQGNVVGTEQAREIVENRLLQEELRVRDDTKNDLESVVLNFAQTQAIMNQEEEGPDVEKAEVLERGAEVLQEIDTELNRPEAMGAGTNPLLMLGILAVFVITVAAIIWIVVQMQKRKKQRRPRKK